MKEQQTKDQLIRPYGDTWNDGKIQLSFTLPVKNNARGKEAARKYIMKLGFTEGDIVEATTLSEEFTFFVAYATAEALLDFSTVEVDVDHGESSMGFEEANDWIQKHIGRKIVIVGACTGSDAHTVGIDAIMNMKGYNHHYGLERYPMVEAYNLGAQVENEELIAFCKKVKADAILVSQVVTQKEVHLHNLTNFVELLEAENLRDQFIICVGGPRIDNKLAMEIGFDAGFGRGTYAEHVATFIAQKLEERMGKAVGRIG